MSLNGSHLHYVVARHRAEILLSSKLTGEDVSRLVLARKKGPLRDSLTEFEGCGGEGRESVASNRTQGILKGRGCSFRSGLDYWQYFTIERNSNRRD